MGTFSIWHWLIVLAVALLLFGGGGKIKKIMGDVGSGITAFKKGIRDEEKKGSESGGSEDHKTIEQETSTVASTAKEKDKAASG